MKKHYLIIAFLLSLSACTIGDRIKELKALRHSKFTIDKIEKIEVSGIDVKELTGRGEINLLSMPSLALGFLNKEIPLKANFILKITNPTDNEAAINEFDYKFLINNYEVVDGSINEKISIHPNDVSLIPFEISFNIYQFLADESVRNEIQNYIRKVRSGEADNILLTIRVKPSILVGNQLIKYPGYVDIERVLNASFLSSYDKYF